MVQPHRICIYWPSDPAAALRWLVGHWKAADIIELRLNGGEDVPFPFPMPANVSSTVPLRRLQLELDNSDSSWSQWIIRLLTHTPALHFLEMDQEYCPELPRVQYLRHLIIELQQTSTGMLSFLQHLPMLETLKLACLRYKPCKDAFVLPPSLRHLCLSDKLPHKLTLQNTACTMHLDSSIFTVRTAVVAWGVEICLQIKSAKVYGPDMNPDSLPSWQPLAGHSNLQLLDLKTERPELLSLHSLAQVTFPELTTLIITVSSDSSASDTLCFV